MSRHYIELSSDVPAGKAAVICGYDRHPKPHYFCNVSESLDPAHIDEPLWASIFDPGCMFPASPDAFDSKLASLGITLPTAFKEALRNDWDAQTINCEVYWKPDGTIEQVCE